MVTTWHARFFFYSCLLICLFGRVVAADTGDDCTLWNFGLPVTKRVADILDFKICSIQFTFYALQLHFSSTKHTKFFIEIQMYKLQKVWHFEKHNSTLLMFGYAAFITAVSVWKLHKVRNKHLPTVSPRLQLANETSAANTLCVCSLLGIFLPNV